jgi:hypothetical protein
MSDGEFQNPYPTESYSMIIMDFSQPETDQDIATFLKETREFIDQLKRNRMTGVEKIAQERLEQKIKHHRSVKSDYELNPDYQLATAAEAILAGNIDKMPPDWDMNQCQRFLSRPYEDRLIIAGALIAAEIDRLNYQE